MKIEKEELAHVLGQYNPWWIGESIPDLPDWHRAVFEELISWVLNPPAPRAVLLSGARQIGKTTLIMQAINRLLKSGVPPSNILYATFDHPLFKLGGIEAVLEAWRSREPRKDGMEYVFLDEAHNIREWGTWVKHQVDFAKHRRIVFTGSATPLLSENQESGVGRWHTIKLTTLSFYEYLQLKKSVQRDHFSLPQLPRIQSLKDLFLWPSHELRHASELAGPYVAHFHDYLIRGGYPQAVLVDTITQAQKLLREDIIDRVLKRDMTAIFGVRRILDLEQTFLYLCRHDGGILDMPTLSKYLSVQKPTAQHYIELLEAAHLIYRLQPYGYGKEVLRGHSKIYLADAAIAPAVMLRGRSVIDDPHSLGVAAEAAVLRHLYARYYKNSVLFSYWRGKKDLEVDLIAEIEGQIIPFEVKYRSQSVDDRMLKGLFTFCTEKGVRRGYVVTKQLGDFGVMSQMDEKPFSILKIPAVLLCYWMGETELQQNYADD